MSIISATAKSAGEFYDYPIEQSLRFDGSSYLSRTFGSNGNSLKLTYSLWVKFSAIGTGASLLLAQTGTQISGMSLTSANQFNFNSLGNTYNVNTTPVYRDTTGWYHVVFTYDGVQTTQSDRAYISVNGVKITDVYSTNSGFFPVSHSQPHLNTAIPHYIGILGTYNTIPLNGYLANIQFIDGQALDASYFGETKSGVWIPKEYTGSYGTNGFRLAFNSSDFNTSGSAVSDPYGSATNLPDGYVADASGSGNHWQVN